LAFKVPELLRIFKVLRKPGFEKRKAAGKTFNYKRTKSLKNILFDTEIKDVVVQFTSFFD